jgi:hypothetical protein
MMASQWREDVGLPHAKCSLYLIVSLCANRTGQTARPSAPRCSVKEAAMPHERMGLTIFTDGCGGEGRSCRLRFRTGHGLWATGKRDDDSRIFGCDADADRRGVASAGRDLSGDAADTGVHDGDLWLMSTPNGRRGFFWDEWDTEARSGSGSACRLRSAHRFQSACWRRRSRRRGTNGISV